MGAGTVGPRDRLNRARNELKPTKKEKIKIFLLNKLYALRDPVPFEKLKNVKNTHERVFSPFFKLYKWYKILEKHHIL